MGSSLGHGLSGVTLNQCGLLYGPTSFWGHPQHSVVSSVGHHAFGVSPPQYGLLHGPQSIQGHPLPGVVSSIGRDPSEMPPLSWSTSFQKCISSHSPNSMPLHVSSFLLPFPHTRLLACLLRCLLLYVFLFSCVSLCCISCPSLLLPFLKHV